MEAYKRRILLWNFKISINWLPPSLYPTRVSSNCLRSDWWWQEYNKGGPNFLIN